MVDVDVPLITSPSTNTKSCGRKLQQSKKSKDVAIPFKRETMTEYYTRGVHSHLLRWFTTCVIMFYGGEYKYAWRFIIN